MSNNKVGAASENQSLSEAVGIPLNVRMNAPVLRDSPVNMYENELLSPKAGNQRIKTWIHDFIKMFSLDEK